jgi:glycosyltransferase involved in cell wall biosynthesis
MNMVFLIDLPELGGAELSVVDYLRFPDKLPFHPILVTPREGPLVTECRKLGVECHILPMPELVEYETTPNVFKTTRNPLRWAHYFLRTAGTIRRLTRFLRAHDTIILHTNTHRSHFYGTLAARLARRKIRVVWTLRSTVEKPWLLTLYAIAGIFADAIACISDPVLEPYKKYPWLRRKMVKIYGSIAISSVRWDEADVARLRDELGLHGKFPVCSSIGQLTPYKGFADLIQAMPAILERLPDAYLLIVGKAFFNDQAYVDALHALVRELNVGHAVKFTGFRYDVPAIIAASDELISATWEEPLGRTILEAMAAGTPVVATNGGGVKEVITDGQDGVLFQLRQVDDLARAIIQVATDSELRQRIIRNARQRVRRFDTLVELAQYAVLYRGVLDGNFSQLLASGAIAAAADRAMAEQSQECDDHRSPASVRFTLPSGRYPETGAVSREGES